MNVLKREDKHQFIVGKPGRGGGMRALRSYAEYWGIQIPDEYIAQQDEYFFASDAARILKDT
ncbi:hypothetical protein [Paenibacillus agilis]|uniref:Uncharacterized protein n=1 Tax=Paenibacillus agilis TaxID=3020863 RepID=A0A559IDP0_9BACL|nr:hypothetical protein [Paenibacillus agilis]TVX85573.1 hypothetical protein FPZ44_24775 [Paenibacillus agilis]